MNRRLIFLLSIIVVLCSLSYLYGFQIRRATSAPKIDAVISAAPDSTQPPKTDPTTGIVTTAYKGQIVDVNNPLFSGAVMISEDALLDSSGNGQSSGVITISTNKDN